MAIFENTIAFSLTFLRDFLSFENKRGGTKGIRVGGIAPLLPLWLWPCWVTVQSRRQDSYKNHHSIEEGHSRCISAVTRRKDFCFTTRDFTRMLYRVYIWIQPSGMCFWIAGAWLCLLFFLIFSLCCWPGFCSMLPMISKIEVVCFAIQLVVKVV